MISRRHFVQTAVAAGPLALNPRWASHAFAAPGSPIACQQYTWFNFYQREEKDWFADYDASFRAFRASGLDGYEPAFGSLEEAERLRPFLKSHDVWMSSLYVNSTLHLAEAVDESIAQAVAIAQAGKSMGARIVVTNPSPIAWGSQENKNDEQLTRQAGALNRLGAMLREAGLTLAYHTHDPELRAGAREFHHMLLASDPANVKLCLDAHWVFRGAGDSQVALFDIVRLYGDRIVELHLRQSHNGIWSETFGDGDIDYRRLVAVLRERGIKPHLVLEQAAEKGTPKTMSTVDAQKQSLAYATEVFAPLMG
ncbi:MAG: sugar phosphate isomerase/epimerase [Rhodothermales bacterium]